MLLYCTSVLAEGLESCCLSPYCSPPVKAPLVIIAYKKTKQSVRGREGQAGLQFFPSTSIERIFYSGKVVDLNIFVQWGKKFELT